MADIEKVIAELEDIQKHLDSGYSFPISWENKIIRDALELLKEYEPKLLTLEEIVKSEVVWIEFASVDGYIEPLFFKRIDRDGDFAFIDKDGAMLFYRPKEYNDSWRCWSARPTDEQRKAEQWEV